MPDRETIYAIRAFNRMYMPSMNLLGNHYLGSEYSVTEARIFFEIYENEGCTATHIAQEMNIDKSYLSRILKNHEKKGYIYRQTSKEDGRAYHLFLTDTGKLRARDFIEKSNQEIGDIIATLSYSEQKQLAEAMTLITKLLGKNSVQGE
ncbi:TPA: MarR family transcriptional regulator [Bacillus anthracis]|uniref:Putative transcriptional regulator, MarR family n=1 Tax=Streptococcus gallolyticus TaxID=315405 RepID=A0A060RFF8_9STRE|nr:MarR family transcriptional regulator [Streptococcus gallolyticus]CDO17020.1 Putative transcriptional regulator, MarR family [Streptococcus gallolyticus]HDR3341913.1 MarR family transcriptional regulator [Bacillus anthracis]